MILSFDSAYFGEGVKGWVPEKFNLQAKDAVSQFVTMTKTWDYSRMDFACEVSTNRKAVFLNILFWAQFDFTPLGIERPQRDAIITKLREAWDFNHIDVALPVCRLPQVGELPESIFRNIVRGIKMLAWRIILRAVVGYAVFCAILAMLIGELAFRPLRVPITQRHQAETAAARFGAALRDVSVASGDGSHLQGWFARPADANNDAVILFHGVGDNRQGMMGFAELFLSNGFAVLVPDSRAQGESGGGFPTYGLKESDDVHVWFDWLAMQQHPKCIFGMGESMGAAIVVQAVKTTPFCAVVAESSFASFRQIAYVRVGQFFHTGPWLGDVALRPAVELAFLYGRLTRGVNLADASPERSAVGSRVPIFLIHGLADDNVPPQQSERIRDGNPAEIVLWKVPKAGHCGAVNAAPQEFDSRVLGWFRSHEAGYAAAPPLS